MKRNISIVIAAVYPALMGFAQVSEPLGELLFEDTLSLIPLHEWIEIPEPGQNTWQVGNTVKYESDSSHANEIVIVTDTINSYPDTVDNHFLLSIPAGVNGWAEGILSFYHIYDTDSLIDGGFIEISYDDRQTWKNVVFDFNHVHYNFTGLYSETDTITGSIPAYSGRSLDWKYTELHWIWIALVKKNGSEQYGKPVLKFRFRSDANNTNKNGWLIKNIVFRGYDAGSAVQYTGTPGMTVFPNPVNDRLYMNIPMVFEVPTIRIYSLEGILKMEGEVRNLSGIDLSALAAGLYFYQCESGGNIIGTGKIIKH
jgi:hypothetical protein